MAQYRQLYRDMTVARSFVAKCSEHLLQQSEIPAAECNEEALCDMDRLKKHHGPVADRAKLGHAGASRRGRVLYTKIRATKCRVLAIVESHQLLLVTGSEAHVLKFQQRAGANFHAEDNDSHREHSWRTTIFLTILIASCAIAITACKCWNTMHTGTYIRMTCTIQQVISIVTCSTMIIFLTKRLFNQVTIHTSSSVWLTYLLTQSSADMS